MVKVKERKEVLKWTAANWFAFTASYCVGVSPWTAKVSVIKITRPQGRDPPWQGTKRIAEMAATDCGAWLKYAKCPRNKSCLFKHDEFKKGSKQQVVREDPPGDEAVAQGTAWVYDDEEEWEEAAEALAAMAAAMRGLMKNGGRLGRR